MAGPPVCLYGFYTRFLSLISHSIMVNYYHYEPSLPIATVFAVIFTLLFALHLFQTIRTRTWFFVPFVIGILCKSAVLFCPFWPLTNKPFTSRGCRLFQPRSQCLGVSWLYPCSLCYAKLTSPSGTDMLFCINLYGSGTLHPDIRRGAVFVA